MSLGDLFFSEIRQRVRSWEERIERGGKGNCSQDGIDERRIEKKRMCLMK